jgi:hypothetical protein
MGRGGHCRVGQWAAELESCWTEARQVRDTRRCIVELIEVTSIDRNGEAVLAKIMSQGVEFIASDVYTKHLLRNLRSGLRRSRMKGKRWRGQSLIKSSAREQTLRRSNTKAVKPSLQLSQIRVDADARQR